MPFQLMTLRRPLWLLTLRQKFIMTASYLLLPVVSPAISSCVRLSSVRKANEVQPSGLMSGNVKLDDSRQRMPLSRGDWLFLKRT
ncbi:hypothetical protein APB19_05950 [Pseudomonas aeruginosa]|nr:hypothetical protein AO932_02475 [Pseudomonas aeruginosa]OFM14382.1 hypothetical protein HMPREF2716_25365 [Pseudomonas sp. HMSC076A11]KSF06870.1 hypothetical protein AO923_25805 [Pseudomonas aeruginosa]KSP56909.1 hypothetical protein APB19_05950 [Pseudomonas aeruginosa]KSQ68760.1 hypothetical protein APB39_01005 [Pseudomonas aeruginosa]